MGNMICTCHGSQRGCSVSSWATDQPAIVGTLALVAYFVLSSNPCDRPLALVLLLFAISTLVRGARGARRLDSWKSRGDTSQTASVVGLYTAWLAFHGKDTSHMPGAIQLCVAACRFQHRPRWLSRCHAWSSIGFVSSLALGVLLILGSIWILSSSSCDAGSRFLGSCVEPRRAAPRGAQLPLPRSLRGWATTAVLYLGVSITLSGATVARLPCQHSAPAQPA